MKMFKIFAITCSALLVTGKLFAQAESATAKETTTTQAKSETQDPVDIFLGRYQSFLENKKPAKENNEIHSKEQTSTQKTVTQEDVTRAYNAVQTNQYNLKNSIPALANDALYQREQQRAQPLLSNYLDALLNLKIANSGPVKTPTVQLNSQADKVNIVKKAIADKKALDKEIAEKAEKTEKVTGNDK